MAERIIPPLPSQTLASAKRLRLGMTDAERELWRHLRSGRLGSFKFRRQHPIPPYVVDFVCLKQLLVIELDGSQHGDEVDETRSRFLERAGYQVLRFRSHDVLNPNASVLASIWSALHDRTLSPTPLPLGEGLKRAQDP